MHTSLGDAACNNMQYNTSGTTTINKLKVAFVKQSGYHELAIYTEAGAGKPGPAKSSAELHAQTRELYRRKMELVKNNAHGLPGHTPARMADGVRQGKNTCIHARAGPHCLQSTPDEVKMNCCDHMNRHKNKKEKTNCWRASADLPQHKSISKPKSWLRWGS